MRNLGLLALRTVLGGYLAVHGSEKLFGSFGGGGVEGTTKGFEQMGLRPAKPMAIAAGVAEFGGGILTATGIAHPLGPTTLAATMAVASSTHIGNGPFAKNGGYEQPLTNCVAALILAAVGPGKVRLGKNLPAAVADLVGLVAAGSAAYLISQVVKAKPIEEAEYS